MGYMAGLVERVRWLGHAGMAVDLPPLLVIDPYDITGDPRKKAGIILVTHSHYDHLDPASIGKISGPDTVLVAPAECLAKLPGNTRPISPGQSMKIGEVEIEAVPAYNINKKFHPRKNGWVGYIVRFGGESIYHAGDTDLIPELEGIKCDIAVLPVSGIYVMTAEEAAEAAGRIRPRFAIPMHYGSVAGTRADAERFKALCRPGVGVRMPPKSGLSDG